MVEYEQTTARVVAAEGEAKAPVSGVRCRGCGANAKLRRPGDPWFIVHMAAWCAACAEEDFRIKPEVSR